jgi:dTDP-4-amino-4,6-dideoxygalactose transaminase
MLTLKPLLPKYHEYKNYLKKIDNKRIYSNYGPLYYKTKKIIEKHFKLKNNSVVLTSSGDASLFACLKYLKYKNKNKKYILVPSFSFSSNIHSIINSGFEPIFLDVNLKDWSLSHLEITKQIKKNKKIAGILIVSPFGYPIDIEYLNRLRTKTQTEIIYDAADTFLNLNDLNDLNFFLTASFHPTKNVPGNESGMIICKKSLEETFKSILNFGQDKKKNIKIFGFNGKISEYDCAILLATLKKLTTIKNKIKVSNQFIIKNVSNHSIVFQKGFGRNWFSNKLNFYSKTLNNNSCHKIFSTKKIMPYRPWTGKPMHLHSFFKKYKKVNLKNTLFLSKKIISIPLNYDISIINLKKICNIFNNHKDFKFSLNIQKDK